MVLVVENSLSRMARHAPKVIQPARHLPSIEDLENRDHLFVPRHYRIFPRYMSWFNMFVRFRESKTKQSWFMAEVFNVTRLLQEFQKATQEHHDLSVLFEGNKYPGVTRLPGVR